MKPITSGDILRGSECPKDYKENLEKLVKRTNKLQELWGKQFIVTSGFRSLLYHLGIYRKKGITDPKKIPMKSRHLFCQAVDIEDKDGRLYKWVQQNEKALEDIGLWYEMGTRGWVHLQIVAPTSGKRGFMP